jgi:hypothetical protein
MPLPGAQITYKLFDNQGIMNGYGCERKRSWLYLRCHLTIFFLENHDILSNDNHPVGRDLNPGLPRYETRVLTNLL